jgi:4-amino-4-deoxy-L-arabinose transferase-like glycosyltransferase
VILATLLVLPGIGATSLWSDEAETALVARNILSTGVPTAFDGRNLVSIFPDQRDVRDGLYYWQPWLQMYLAAGSMAVFGTTSFAARLPFCLAFVVLVGVSYRSFRRWHPDRQRALIASALMLTSLPLLLHARQCRYYLLVPLFSVLLADAYLALLEDPRLRRGVLLIAWFTLLFNSLYPAAVLMGLVLGIDLLRRWLSGQRPSPPVLRLLLVAAAGALIVNLPMAVYSTVWHRPFGSQPGYSGLDVFGVYLLRYVLTLNNDFFPLLLVLAAAAWHWRELVRRRWSEHPATALCLTACGVQLGILSLTTNYPFSRYMIGMAPFLLFLASGVLLRLSGHRVWLAGSLAGVVMLTNALHVLPLIPLRLTPLQDAQWTVAGVEGRFLEARNPSLSYGRGEVKELINQPVGLPIARYIGGLGKPAPGPIDAIVEYLAEHAVDSDRVKIAYGDLPLMFHTKLRVTNAHQVGEPAPEWMIPRHFSPMRTDATFRRETERHAYEKTELAMPDLQWNNRPDPLYHHFGSPDPDSAPPVQVWRRLD